MKNSFDDANRFNIPCTGVTGRTGGCTGYCTGGCAANADAFHDGDLTKPYDMECEMEKKRLECAIAVTAGEMDARGEAE